MNCADCGKSRVVMIAMEPGLDKKPWQLCGHCFVESTRRPAPLPVEEEPAPLARQTSNRSRAASH